MITDDQQGQIIIITVVLKVSWLFIADHSELETAGAVERERERVENSRSGTK